MFTRKLPLGLGLAMMFSLSVVDGIRLRMCECII